MHVQCIMYFKKFLWMIFHEIGFGSQRNIQIGIFSMWFSVMLFTSLEVSSVIFLYYPIIFAGIFSCLNINDMLQNIGKDMTIVNYFYRKSKNDIKS